MLRVFISGIAGFLGSHIAREGAALGWDITGIDNLIGGDPSNLADTGIRWEREDCRGAGHYDYLLRGCDTVYHCAAAPYEGLSVFSPQVVFENTLMSTVGLLRSAINAKVKRFIFCSSMSRYGHQEAPFTEDMAAIPADPYAIAKVASEDLVRNLCELHGLEWVIAIPHNIYGPGQRYWDPYRNVAGIMINRILLGKTPVVYGDGSQRRCLSYISDVTEPLLKLATADVAGEIINVGPGDEGCTILELAETIISVLRSPVKPEFFPARPGEVHSAHCSDEKARKLLDYKPVVPLLDGLGRYANWIKEKNPRQFEYHLPIEIKSDITPRTWSERLM